MSSPWSSRNQCLKTKTLDMLWNVVKCTKTDFRSQQTLLNSAHLNGSYFHLGFSKGISCHLRWRWKNTFKKNPASISFQTCIIISPVCCPPRNLLFFCNSYFLTRMKELYCPLRPARFKRSDEVGKEMYTSKFRFGEAVLWSKDASISVEVHLCNVLNSELMNGADFFF